MNKLKKLLTAVLLLSMLVFVAHLDTQEQTSTADIVQERWK